MSVNNRYVRPALLALLLWQAPLSGARAETPREQLQTTIDRVMEVTGTFQKASDADDNRELLRGIISPRFDFFEMARRSLGGYWTSLNGREEEFVAAFAQFAENSYMGALGSYRGEEIVYGRERVSREVAEVDTEVVDSKGEKTPVIYRLHRVGENWKVYDVVIDHVSLVSNYQSQFSRILRRASLDELFDRLRARGERNRD